MKLLTSGKLLMFAKVSFAGFIYEFINAFCFPDEKFKIYTNKTKL